MPSTILINQCIIRVMKRKLLRNIPTVFSLQANSDYSKFVVYASASEMMYDTWVNLGKRLNQSIVEVGRDVEKESKQLEKQ